MKKTINNGGRALFGTDGIRGVANTFPMTTEMALRLGRAVATVFRTRHSATGRHPRIVIGKDTRLSGYMFETALAAGITSVGADIWLVGPLPTPGIAFITSNMRADAGIVISASHNPHMDNGLKLFSKDGFKLPDSVEAAIEVEMQAEAGAVRLAPPDQIGRATRIDDAVGRYTVYLKNTFPRGQTLDGMKVVLDCANGGAYKVGPAVFDELGARVFPLGVHPDGLNINDACGSLHPELISREVLAHQADIGIALDGDADRVVISDERGEILDGDAIKAICAQDLMRRGELKKNTVVATVMSNIGLDVALKRIGVRLVRTDVGDRYVVERMRKEGYCFGGEQSGHLIFLEHSSTGDGVLAALRLLAVVQESGRPLSELRKVFKAFPQVLENVVVREKMQFSQVPGFSALIRRVEKKLGKTGRVLVRYSGTEPKARIMVEGEDAATIRTYAQEMARTLQKSLGV